MLTAGRRRRKIGNQRRRGKRKRRNQRNQRRAFLRVHQGERRRHKTEKEAAGIAFTNVTFRYHGSERAAWRNFSLSIPAGQITAILLKAAGVGFDREVEEANC
jgi:ABC-type multidrug transport system fused ATPase/permease subunit